MGEKDGITPIEFHILAENLNSKYENKGRKLTPRPERSPLKADSDLFPVVQGTLMGTHRWERRLLPASDRCRSLQAEAEAVTAC